RVWFDPGSRDERLVIDAAGHAATSIPAAETSTDAAPTDVALTIGAVVDGRVVDAASRRPLANVHLKVGSWAESAAPDGDTFPLNGAGTPLAVAMTGADGGFVLDGIDASDEVLVLDGAAPCTAIKLGRMSAGETRHLGDVALAAGGSVEGAVIA